MCRTDPRVLAVLVAVAVLGPPPGPRAQQAPPAAATETVIRPRGPVYGLPDASDPTRQVWVFLGGVEVERGAQHLSGDTLVVFVRRQAEGEPAPEAPTASDVVPVPESRLLELFLDGNVSLTDGEERISGASTWHLDNATGVATVVQGELLAPRRAGEAPIAARFDTLHRLQDGTLRLDGFRYTNCTYGHPHWHIETPWAELRRTPDGRVLETAGNVVRVGEVPVFWLPGYTLNLDRPGGLLLRRVSAGSSSRFGNELQVEWGADASAAASAVAGLFGGPTKVEADWSLTAAYYSDRGVFLEPKLKYRTADSRGEIFGSYIRDRADEDHLGQPIDDSSRGRIDLQHRTQLDERRTLDIEVSRQSDANYLREYYEREFREDKPQETYVSYRDVVENKAFTVLGSERLNDFDEQVEYQPEVVGRMVGEPFAGGFLSSKGLLSRARKLAPDDPSLNDDLEASGPPSDEFNTRAGQSVQVDWPLDLPGGDRLRAQLGADVTWFERTVVEGSAFRGSGSAGVEWVRAFHGSDPDARSEDWNIEGLRRLAELHLGYFDRYYTSMLPGELIPIDQVETLAPVRAFTLQWRDRWLTGPPGQTRTLLDTDWLLPIFPDQDRDNGGDTLGPLVFDARWEPAARLVALSDAVLAWRTEQDLEEDHWLKSFASFNTGLGQGRRLHLSRNSVFHEFDFVTAAITWQLNPRWAVATYWQLDQRLGDRVRSGVVLRQLAHCWYVDLEVGTRRGDSASGDNEDETRVSLSLTPAGLHDEDLAQSLGGRYF
jgi:hypothetical protein